MHLTEAYMHGPGMCGSTLTTAGLSLFFALLWLLKSSFSQEGGKEKKRKSMTSLARSGRCGVTDEKHVAII